MVLPVFQRNMLLPSTRYSCVVGRWYCCFREVCCFHPLDTAAVIMNCLHFEINSFCRDFAHKLSLALIANNNNRLHTLDLSNNMIEDKGKTFCFMLPKLCVFISCETWATDVYGLAEHDWCLHMTLLFCEAQRWCLVSHQIVQCFYYSCCKLSWAQLFMWKFCLSGVAVGGST